MVMALKILVFILLLFGLTLGVSGCLRSPLNIYLHASPNLNLDVLHQPLPVQLKVFQLRDANAFRQASFHGLWQHDTAVLGESLLDKRVVVLDPAASMRLSLRRRKGCRYVGVMALFRKPPQDRSWRRLYVVPAPLGLDFLPVAVHVYVANNRIEES